MPGMLPSRSWRAEGPGRRGAAGSGEGRPSPIEPTEGAPRSERPPLRTAPGCWTWHHRPTRVAEHPLPGRTLVDTRANTVDGVVRRSARPTPDRTALVFADRSWTYRELDDAVSRAAGWLRGLGLVQGDRVAAYGRNSDAYLLSFLGAARL